MNSDWEKMMKQLTAMPTVNSSLDIWKNLTLNSRLLAFQKNQPPINRLNQILQEMFIKQAGVNSMKTIADAINKKTIKPNHFINPNFWNYASGIARNQQNISSLFSNNLSTLHRTIKAQVGTPSFLTSTYGVDYLSKLTTLQQALVGVSRQITTSGFLGIDNDLLKRFQKTTNEAVALTEEITETPVTTTEAIERLESFVQTSFEEFKAIIEKEVLSGIKKSQKSGLALISLWSTIIGIILTIITIIQFHQSQNEQATKVQIKEKQIQELKDFIHKKFQQALDDATIKVKANINTTLRYNPSLKSSGSFWIKAGEIAHIIDSKHKWIRITLIDPADSLPVSGWVLKKHFVRVN